MNIAYALRGADDRGFADEGGFGIKWLRGAMKRWYFIENLVAAGWNLDDVCAAFRGLLVPPFLDAHDTTELDQK